MSCALGLLMCGVDGARKSAASFLASCLHIPVVLQEFAAQVGVGGWVGVSGGSIY